MTDETWPGAGRQLLESLRRHPGQVALVAGRGADETVRALASVEGRDAVSVGDVLTRDAEPPPSAAVERALAGSPFLIDLDILFWRPGLQVDPMALLHRLARSGPCVAVWPGRVQGGEATYSEPGRPDHHRYPLDDVVVLRPRTQRFPDELPYRVES